MLPGCCRSPPHGVSELSSLVVVAIMGVAVDRTCDGPWRQHLLSRTLPVTTCNNDLPSASPAVRSAGRDCPALLAPWIDLVWWTGCTRRASAADLCRPSEMG